MTEPHDYIDVVFHMLVGLAIIVLTLFTQLAPATYASTGAIYQRVGDIVPALLKNSYLIEDSRPFFRQPPVDHPPTARASPIPGHLWLWGFLGFLKGQPLAIALPVKHRYEPVDLPTLTDSPPFPESIHDDHLDMLIQNNLPLSDDATLNKTLFEWTLNLPASPLNSGSGGGDDDGDDGNNQSYDDSEPDPLIVVCREEIWLAQVSAEELLSKTLKNKRRLLRIVHKKLRRAIAKGNSELVKILRNRLMLIEAELDELERSGQPLSPALLSRVKAAFVSDQQELQNYDDRSLRLALSEHPVTVNVDPDSLIIRPDEMSQQQIRLYLQWLYSAAGLLYSELKQRLLRRLRRADPCSESHLVAVDSLLTGLETCVRQFQSLIIPGSSTQRIGRQVPNSDTQTNRSEKPSARQPSTSRQAPISGSGLGERRYTRCLDGDDGSNGNPFHNGHTRDNHCPMCNNGPCEQRVNDNLPANNGQLRLFNKRKSKKPERFYRPIRPIDGAAPPPKDNGNPADNGSQKRKRKGSQAGHQVNPTTKARKTLPEDQQTSGQPFIPPIELRSINHDHWRVVSTSGEQSTQEPMETEPDTLAPAGDNIIEPIEDEDSTEITPNTLSMFIPCHQEELLKLATDGHLETNQSLKAVVKNAKKLYNTLRHRKIKLSKNKSTPPVSSLVSMFSKFKKFSLAETSEVLSKYYAKATVFFSKVNTDQIKGTGCLSAMLYTKSQIESFAERSEENIRAIAEHSFLKRISSMNNCRGFPTRAQVEAFMSMACLKQGWQGNDEDVQGNPVDQELLMRIASMNSGKGFPTKAQVEAFMTMACLKQDWQGNDEDVQGNPVDRELLMHIASMNNGRGFPTRKTVEAFMTMACLKQGWRGSDEDVKGSPIGRELLVRIVSMNHARGFPTRAQVEAFINMACLKQNWHGNDEDVQGNPIDRELLLRITSMHNAKGFPTRAQVEAFMTMACLKQDWQGNDEDVQGNPIDRELLIRIASMNSRRGFPTKAQVEAFMTMACLKQGWQGNDENVKDKPVDRELLMRIASMNNRKGFPTRKQVEAFMTMTCLKQGWQGNDEAVQGSPVNKELLMRITSMHNAKGFPTRAQVEAFMTMACLKQNWQGNDEAVKGSPVDWELLMRIASMNNRKGFPTRAQVEAFMTMACLKQGWQGSDEAVEDKLLDRELLMRIASMNHGRGFPTSTDVEVFVQWLPEDNRKHCLKVASRVFVSSGLPKPSALNDNERTIRQYLPENSLYSSDDISNLDHVLPEADQIKVLALFCSAPRKWHLKIAEFEQYLTACTIDRNSRTEVLSALASLFPILFNHGGEGVRFWLAMHDKNQHDRRLLTKTLSIPTPLNTTKFALTQIPQSECLEYIALCQNLNPAPNKAQWAALKPLRQQLDQQCTIIGSKSMMLEILWPQPEAKRSEYAEKLDSLFKIVPTVPQLHRIHQAFGPQKMRDFLDTCIARQFPHANALGVKAQEHLLEGLLLAHHYLNDHEQIPDLCFSKQNSSTDGKGVIINGDADMAGQQRLLYFIAAMLIELKQTTEYQFEREQLRVFPPDGEPVVLPKPEFKLANSGFVINNWSLEQVRAFFEATEFTERWYRNPQDRRELFSVRRDERLARMRAKTDEAAGNKKATPLLAPNIILSVIKSGHSLKPAVWESLEHYAKNGQLTARLCKVLAPVIQKQEANVPDIVKHAVTKKLAEIDADNMADEVTITQPPTPVTGSLIQRPHTTFETAMAALDRFEVLGEIELEILEPYRDQMTPIQLTSVIHKMSHGVDAGTQTNWRIDYEKKKKGQPGLNKMGDPDHDWP